MKNFLTCVYILCLFNFTFADLIVAISEGQIRGKVIETQGNKFFYTFRGIPFATSPLGKLRFLPPEPVKPWNGVLDATEDGASCIFFGGYSGDPIPEKQSEDCLFINVFSPTKNVSANLPVMVWIYGGGFTVGSSSQNFYDPSPFFEEDVIVVTFNYRHSTLGFLSTEDSVILGNAALKDQVLALEWTRRNIGYFGGDSEKVTIFGESAGGVSVGYHLLSKKSSGLFRAAICQSGCALTNHYQTNARSFAYQLANSIDQDITTQNSSIEIRDFLQNQPLELLVNLTLSLGQQVRPVIEVEDDNSFLTKPNFDLIANGEINKVPLILGHMAEESANMFMDIEAALQVAKLFDQNWLLSIPMSLNKLPDANSQDIAQDIRSTYVGTEGLFEKQLASFLEWFSDNDYVRSTLKQAELQSNYTPIYLYQFSFNGSKSKNHIHVPGASNVGHADDVPYLFNVSTYPIETDADFLTRKRIVQLWTNFAKTLNPTPAGDTDSLLNVTWEKVTPHEIQYLNIDEKLQMKPNRKEKEMQLWDNIWNTYGTRPFITF